MACVCTRTAIDPLASQFYNKYLISKTIHSEFDIPCHDHNVNAFRNNARYEMNIEEF